MNLLAGLAALAALALPILFIYGLVQIGAPVPERPLTLEEMYPDEHIFV